MAEQENSAPEGEKGDAPQYTESETRAMEQGWVPKEQWTGEGKWRDAESFLDRGELFGKIDAQNRKLKSTEQALAAMQQHYAKVAETEYKRALETLQKQKKEALIDNDVDTIVKLDDEIADLKMAKQSAPPPAQAVAAEPNPEFVAWENKNTWYRDSGPMRAYADRLGQDLAAQGKSPSEILREVSAAVRKDFPTKFSNPNRDRPSGVEGADTPRKASNSHVELSETEAQIMKKLVGQGVLTKDQYLADIRKQRERQ